MANSGVLRRIAQLLWKRKTPLRNPSEHVEAESYPEQGRDSGRFGSDFLSLPDHAPFEMLSLYRHLRDNIPDVSDAVWSWKRLCHTGHDVMVEGMNGNTAPPEARAAVDAFAARVHAADGGLPELLDIFYASLFTYGAAALEVV
ncbi:MAG: hypothetical protein KAH38_06610, partial [Candidatus Hydrogenedentes bacterium]|nr:hypothetical protein [Candidatus Hydrogenedentota bacterium]